MLVGEGVECWDGGLLWLNLYDEDGLFLALLESCTTTYVLIEQ